MAFFLGFFSFGLCLLGKFVFRIFHLQLMLQNFWAEERLSDGVAAVCVAVEFGREMVVRENFGRNCTSEEGYSGIYCNIITGLHE